MIDGRRAQVWPYERAFRRPRHFHAEPELNVVVRGRGVIGVGDQRLAVSAGSALFFKPGQDHVLLDESADFELFVMALTPELAARVGGSRPMGSGRLLSLDDQELTSVTARLGACRELRDGSAIETQLGDLFRSMSARLGEGHSISRRALVLVHREPGLSESALAQRLSTTTSTISRAFHHDLGVTFVEYRARLRLMRFVSSVDAGRNFGQAAVAANFGSYVYCHRVFQRVLGCSPMEYFGGARARIDAATFYSVLKGKRAAEGALHPG